jgi:urea transport system permease protein
MTLTAFLEAVLNGLSFGSILVLTAAGLAITFGVMRVINMAHGEMLMLGAYIAYILRDTDALPRLLNHLGFAVSKQSGLSLDLFTTILLSFLIVGFIGWLLEVLLVRRLYGRPLDTLLATWGVSLALQEGARILFGPDSKNIHRPPFLDTTITDVIPPFIHEWFELEPVPLHVYRLFIIGVAAVCILAIYLCFYWTRFGLKVRAVTQNRAMASAVGISTRWVDSLTFAFGTGLAGVAGCIFAHMYTFDAYTGPNYVVDAFIVVILGGMGSLTGTVVAGLLLGICNSVLVKFLDTFQTTGGSSDMLAKASVLLVVVIFLLIRPSGLISARERVYD